MKSIKALVLSLIVFSFISVSAQEKLNQISVHHGLITVDQIELCADDFFSNLINGIFCDESSITSLYFTGPLGISYQTKINKFGYGASFYYLKGRRTSRDYKLTSTFYNIYYDLKYYWYTNEKIKISSGISLGLTLKNKKEWDIDQSPQSKENSGVTLAYQFDVMSFQLGRNLTLDMDIGFGRKGCVVMGLGYQF